MATNAIAVATTASLSALGKPKWRYDQLDCQAWVEWVLRENGFPRNWSGSNRMFRTACSWTGKVAEAKAQGKLLAGAMTFKIRTPDERCPAEYRNDGIGDVYHVGLYCAGINGVEVGHSSTGGSQASKLAPWTHIGLVDGLEYGVVIGGGTVSPDAPVIVGGYITATTNVGSVNMRKSPGGDYMLKVPQYTTLQVSELKTVDGTEYGKTSYITKTGKYAGTEYEGWVEMRFLQIVPNATGGGE